MKILYKAKDILIEKGFLVYFLIGLFALFHFYLISKTFAIDDTGNIHTSYNAYGDIPFHMTQVSKFGYGSLLNFNEPLFSGERIRYSFIINYISGILIKFTHSWTFAIHAPPILFVGLSYLFIFLIYRKVLNKNWAAFVALIIFFLGSGTGGYTIVKDKMIDDGLKPSAFANYLTDNNVFTFTNLKATYPQQNTDWSSPLSLSFLHQRSFFLGIFLFSLFFYLITCKIKNSENKAYLFLAGLVFGLGPLGHYHTFVIMGIVASFYLINSLRIKDYVLFKKIFIVCVVAGIIALPQVIYLISGNSPGVVSGDHSIIKFRLGWMTEPGIGSVQYPPGDSSILSRVIIYLIFLWVNFGFILPLFLLGLLIKRIRSSMANFFWLAGIIFIINQFFQLQPWDYDNNKILVYFGFFTAPIIASIMVYAISKFKWIGPVLATSMLVLVIFSGVIDMIPRYLVKLENTPIIFNSDAVNMADYIRQNTSPQDTILATTTHLNPANSLAGRPAVVGFPGWLWTKGVDFGPREQDLKSFYNDPVNNIYLAEKYNANYVLIDPTAIYGWRVDKNIFDDSFDELFNSGEYTLYRLK